MVAAGVPSSLFGVACDVIVVVVALSLMVALTAESSCTRITLSMFEKAVPGTLKLTSLMPTSVGAHVAERRGCSTVSL